MKHDSILKVLYRFFDLIVVTYLVFDFGFNINTAYEKPKLFGLVGITVALLSFNVFKYFYYTTKARKRVALFNSSILLGLLVCSASIAIYNYDKDALTILNYIRPLLEAGLTVYFFIRLMILVRYIYEVYYNPAIVFVGSFFAIILIGGLLLMMPKATTHPISFTDALFTSTSAVCVTGLVVLDTAKDYTLLGQTIIMILIQIGGLGILTFTSFFSYFFKGSSSFKEGLNVRDFIANENLRDVLKSALNVVLLTLALEFIGGIFIYFSILDNPNIEDKFFFSMFHCVSAFCNAGFSTFSAGLNETHLKFNYFLQWIIMFLIIFGGLGHNIVFNFFQNIKCKVARLIDDTVQKRVRVITLNTKIVVFTTIFLLLGGAILIYITEFNNTLTEHETVFGKVTASFFHSVTPRTAGFNAVDYSLFSVPSLLIIIFLMWVGASPASTGGGIKTSTFAIATLNIWATARGKSRIELFGRRISAESTSRAFSIISISLIIIGIASVSILAIEPEGTSLIAVVFECFSAYSTVGLSLNFTPTLSDPSKYVLIATMFFGRIGMLNLLLGLFSQLNHQFYEYPKENILIN
jgi:trk system potassium uptake protein